MYRILVVTACWGSIHSPDWHRSSGEPGVVSYHRAIFVPVSFEASEFNGSSEGNQHGG